MAYSQERSVLEIVPESAFACVKFDNLMELDLKISDMIDSMEIPETPPVSIAEAIGKLIKLDVKTMMDIEKAGFDTERDSCIFWTAESAGKLSFAVHIRSKKQVDDSAKQILGGVGKEHKGITYMSSKDSEWAILGNVFVYSKTNNVLPSVIDTYNGNKPSILRNSKYNSSVESVKTGDLKGYINMEGIMSKYLPDLQKKADEAKAGLSKQMNQQKSQPNPMPFDPVKIVSSEMDMGLWILQQISSYTLSVGIGMESLWFNDSINFKLNSPVNNFLNIKPGRLNLVKRMPGDVIIAGGLSLDASIFEKLNAIMFDVFFSPMNGNMKKGEIEELKKKYVTATHEMFSCMGDEVAYAISSQVDKAMPRVIYIFEIADEAKAQETITNLEYITDMYGTFYKAFGMNPSISGGLTLKYNGTEINSFEIDLQSMIPANSPPEAKGMFPETIFLWYAFVDDKLVYAMSQSADTIKDAIDALNERTISIADSRGFDDIDIRLPDVNNSITYVSPAGYMSFIMNMMASQMGNTMPSMDMPKSDVGLAVVTNCDENGIRNYTYFLLDEIRDLVSIIQGLSQMAKPQVKPQPPK